MLPAVPMSISAEFISLRPCTWPPKTRQFRSVSKTVSDLIEDAPRKITPDRLPFSNLSSVRNMIIIAARVLEEVNDVSQKRGIQSGLTGSCVTPENF
jgi:hypothetical protein